MSQDSNPPPLPAARTSKLAIASLTLGCGSFLFCIVTGIPALICGIIAMVRTKKNPFLQGWNMALAGTILGGLSIVMTPFMAGLLVPMVNGALAEADRTRELTQVHQLGKILIEYAQSHDGKFPDSLETLKTEEIQVEGGIDRLIYFENSRDLKWLLTPGLTIDSPPETILLKSNESRGTGSKKGRAVCMVAGNAKWIRDDGKKYNGF